MDKMMVTIVGRLDDVGFLQSQELMEGVMAENVNIECELIPLVETDFELYLENELWHLGEAAAQHQQSPLIFYNGKQYIGNEEALIEFIAMKYFFKLEQDHGRFEQLASVAYPKYYAESNHQFCQLFFVKNGQELGRVVFELYTDICPKACENFIQLCDGSGPTVNGKFLSYENTTIHRVVEKGWIQGGDIMNNSHGDGQGHSVFGEYFPDESFSIAHDKPGILSMANTGVPHTNGSQFFVTLAPLEWLDQKRIAFGRVIRGMKFINIIGEAKTKRERPIDSFVISGTAQISI